MTENVRDKIYWHEGFYGALQYELHEYKDSLKFQYEHQLSKEALRMDVLIIKKDKGVRIEKNIGRIFREHNIFEFKSESDSLSLWDYNKVFGYAFLYSSFEQVPVPEITVSVALTMFPRELVKYLENERGLKVRDMDNGLYYIDGEIFPVQILECKRLSPDSNVFLRNLRSNLSAEDISNTLQFGRKHNLLDDKNVYLDRLIKANHGAFTEAMNMTEAVKEIILEGVKEYGWLANEFEQNNKEKAKKMLMRGYPVEEVAEIMELPIETVKSLQ